MKILIAAIGKWRACPEQEIFNDYLKRTRWKITLKEMEAKAQEPLVKKEKEGEMLLEAAGKARKIILDEKGKILSTREFASALSDLNSKGNDGVALLIGGADGHTEAVRSQADLVLSLGKMTWPHMLVRPMLMEQLYRAWCLANNHPYHRD